MLYRPQHAATRLRDRSFFTSVRLTPSLRSKEAGREWSRRESSGIDEARTGELSGEASLSRIQILVQRDSAKNLATLSNQFAVNPDRQWEFPLWQISTTRKQFTSISKGRYGRHSSLENVAANEMT